MNKIKVVVVTEIISPYRIPVFNDLAENPQFDLTVLFLAETDVNRQWKIVKEMIEFPYHVLEGFVVRRSQLNFPILFNPSILQELQRQNYNCLILGGYHHPSMWLALTHARMTRKVCFLWSESTLQDFRSPNPFKESFKRFLVSQARGYLVPGKAQRQYLLSLGANPEKIWFAPNSVDSKFFEGALIWRQQKEKIKQKLKIEGDVILYVGRLVDDKGIPELIDAFERVKQEYETVNLVLLGDGSDREKYIKECQSRGLTRVFWPGFQQQEALLTYYAIADIFVFPTRSDPWGLVLNEAMSAGLPLICSRAAGAADDLVQFGENGWLHEVGNTQELVEYMGKLLQDPQLRQKMGQRSHQIIAAYTPEKTAQGFVEAICANIKQR